MDGATLLQAALRGAVVGLGSGLFALALVVTFRTTKVLNLALGGIASIAAFTLWSLWADRGVPLVPALLVSLAAAGALGIASERALRPLRDATVVVKAIGALGVLLVLQAVVSLVWGPGDRFLPLLVRGAITVAGAPLAWQQVITGLVTLGAALALWAWTRWSPSGIATLAVAEDPDAARLLGVRPGRASLAVWAIAGVLAGAAGVLLSGFTVLNGTEMTLALVTALAAALIAGFASVPAAVAAAAGVGAASAAVASVPELARISGLVESTGFVAVVVVVLLVRPRRGALSLERA